MCETTPPPRVSGPGERADSTPRARDWAFARARERPLSSNRSFGLHRSDGVLTRVKETCKRGSSTPER